MKKSLLIIGTVIFVAVAITVVLMWPRPVQTKVFRNELQAYSISVPQDWRGYPMEHNGVRYSIGFNDPVSDQAFQNLLFSAAIPGTKPPVLVIDKRETGFPEPPILSSMEDILNDKFPDTYRKESIELNGVRGTRITSKGSTVEYVLIPRPESLDTVFLITFDPTIPGIEDILQSFTFLPVLPL